MSKKLKRYDINKNGSLVSAEDGTGWLYRMDMVDPLLAEQAKTIEKQRELLERTEELLRVDPTISDMSKYLGATLNRANEIREHLKQSEDK